MNYLQFDFTTTAEQTEQLIALLADAGFEGFEEVENGLKAFIPKDSFEQETFDKVMEVLPVKYIWEEVAPQNWNANWESSFEPIRVNDFVGIRATFHAPVEGVQHEIIITPKMSFGTGHHATTWLMIEQMRALPIQDKTVLDFGTGTGVLAILAEKLGAASVTAIDNDEWSIDNAAENIGQNACNKISLYQADSIPAGQQYDIILANINLNVILASLPAIVAAATPATHILLSGFLMADEVTLFKELAMAGFACTAITQRGEWICLWVNKMK